MDQRGSDCLDLLRWTWNHASPRISSVRCNPDLEPAKFSYVRYPAGFRDEPVPTLHPPLEVRVSRQLATHPQESLSNVPDCELLRLIFVLLSPRVIESLGTLSCDVEIVELDCGRQVSIPPQPFLRNPPIVTER